MISTRLRAAAAAASVALAAIATTGSAVAGIVLDPLEITLVRQSDTVVQISAIGYLQSNAESFMLFGPVVSDAYGSVVLDGDLMLGTSPFNYSNYSANDLLLDFDGFQDPGTGLTGSGTLTLTGGSWAAVGSSGTLSSSQGTWSMVADAPVPLPAGLALLPVGIAAFGLLRRKKG